MTLELTSVYTVASPFCWTLSLFCRYYSDKQVLWFLGVCVWGGGLMLVFRGSCYNWIVWIERCNVHIHVRLKCCVCVCVCKVVCCLEATMTMWWTCGTCSSAVVLRCFMDMRTESVVLVFHLMARHCALAAGILTSRFSHRILSSLCSLIWSLDTNSALHFSSQETRWSNWN